MGQCGFHSDYTFSSKGWDAGEAGEAGDAEEAGGAGEAGEAGEVNSKLYLTYCLLPIPYSLFPDQ
ncbi:hypothetical protein [Coleofasciculus sp. E2-BRE-01]|uniref:hypothetical protein n=1 Tax=Coleofasciculus sp. E2-BRE-01 TaxID=3069524 RepID=UPI0032FA17CD